ncbi:hypothetical protein GCM10009541_12870 [Micromonospora gifhornensis]|uniref:Uncharacterized protein n=1 Tax=Micromonospora gifhornensis TaxID=84594 RepID=A0ABQ4IIB5_9ACTN|nr:hypothetical protein Vgi01_43380 [Micromonospora gifhornensis]
MLGDELVEALGPDADLGVPVRIVDVRRDQAAVGAGHQIILIRDCGAGKPGSLLTHGIIFIRDCGARRPGSLLTHGIIFIRDCGARRPGSLLALIGSGPAAGWPA